MGRLTSKYQITVPKAVARTAGLMPGDELDCESAGDAIRIRAKIQRRPQGRSTTDQLILFDLATERQRQRERSQPKAQRSATERGWTRDELYET